MALAMPCKRSPNGITPVVAKLATISKKTPKAVRECIVVSDESTGQRVESFQPKNHEGHIAGNGFTSMSHSYLVHMFIPMPQDKYRMQKQQWTRNAKSSRQFQHRVRKKSRAKRRLFWKHKRAKRKSALQR